MYPYSRALERETVPRHANATADENRGYVFSHLRDVDEKRVAYPSKGAGNETEFNVPAYLVVLIKRLENFDFVNATVQIHVTMVLRVVKRGVPAILLPQLRNINVRVNMFETINFSPNSPDNKGCHMKEDADLIIFTLRQKLEDVTFCPELHNFPFDFQQVQLRFELTSTAIRVKDGPNGEKIVAEGEINEEESKLRESPPNANESRAVKNESIAVSNESIAVSNESKQEHIESVNTRENGSSSSKLEKISLTVPEYWRVKFNLHIHAKWDVMLRIEKDTSMLDAIPEYNVAFGLLEFPIVEQEQRGVAEGLASPDAGYPAITCIIPLYREPEYVLLSSFVPLIFLNIISIGVFLLDYDDFGTRLGTIITILLALFAFLPSYRSQVPNLPTITMLDVYILLSVLGMLLGFVDSAVGTLYGNVLQLRFILGASCLAAISAVPCYATWLYIKYRRKKAKLDDQTPNELYGKDVKIKRKFITSSAAPFKFDEWKHPAEVATEILPEPTPPTNIKQRVPKSPNVNTPLTTISVSEKHTDYTKLS